MFYDALTRLVVIEDNPADLMLIKEALHFAGVQAAITHYADGADALADIRSYGDAWRNADAVVLDLNMPRVNGLDVLRAIRENPNLLKIPVVIVTSSQSPADVTDAMAFGATRYVKKPVELNAFLSSVGTALRDVLEASR